MNVAILLWNEAILFEAAAGAHVFFSVADGLPWHVYTAGTSPTVVTAEGLRVMPEYTLESAPLPDVIFMPGGGHYCGCHGGGLTSWLESAYDAGAVVICVASDALPPVAASLPGRRKDVASGGLAPRVPTLVPGVEMPTTRRWTVDDRLIVAADALAGVDAALHVIDRLIGARFARAAARAVGYELAPRAGQPPFPPGPRPRT